jgi:Secretion system C-terminal sorting domain
MLNKVKFRFSSGKTRIFLISVCSFLLSNQCFSQSNITYERRTQIDIGTGADVCADAVIINGTSSGGGTICQRPLPVKLSSFNFSVSKNCVILSWTTDAELNNSGFEVERKSEKEGTQWEKTGFVPGNGTVNEPRKYTYQDMKLNTGNYSYRLKQIDFNGNHEYFELESDVVIAMPNIFSMSQNYPNPSNPKSKIDYEIPVDGKVTLRLYDILGKEEVSIVNETKTAGYYSAEFDGTNLSSGVYFYRILVEGGSQKFSKTLKMILVK